MIVQRIQTIIVVSIISALVWLYAEGQNLKTFTSDITAHLVYPPGSAIRVRPANDINPTFSIEVAGATQAVKRLEFSAERMGLQLEVGRHGLSLAPGTHQIPVIEVFEQHDLFKGLSIRSVSPQLLEYTVEHLVDYELPVISSDLTGAGISADISFNPPVVTVNLPEALLNELRDRRGADGLHAVATLEPERLRALESGLPHTLRASVDFPMVAEKGIYTLSDNTVQATIMIRSQTQETIVSQVPIRLSLPPTDQNKYIIQLETLFIPQVQLSGTSETIADLENGNLILKAVLELSSDELTRGITEKVVSYYRLADTLLPPGLKITSDPFTATFTITKRDGGE